MSRWVAFSAVALALASAVAARAAWAEERRTMTLDYAVADGAVGCPSKADVQARLAEEVGYDPIVATAPTFTTTFEVTPTPNGWSGRYISHPVSGDASVRDLSSDLSCDDLVSSFVLAAAISLDPDVKPRVVPTPAPTPEPRVVSVPVPVFIDRPVLVPRDKPSTPLHVTVHAGYGVGGGLVPGAGHGPIAYLGLRGEAWEVGVEGSYLLEGNETSSVGDVLVSAAFASILPCYAPVFATRFRFFGCGHVALGGGFIDAARVTTPSPSTVPIALLGARVGVGLHIAGPLEVRLLGDLLADLTPIDASIRDHGSLRLVFTSSPVVGRGVLALGLSFP